MSRILRYQFSAGYIFCLLVVSCSSQHSIVSIQGTVSHLDGRPAVGALVRIQGTENFTLSSDTGKFSLVADEEGLSFVVTAWAQGFYSVSAEPEQNYRNLKLTLEPIPSEDHPEYKWQSPYETEGCIDCHAVPIVAQWEGASHSRAANNQILLTMYSGTDVHGKPEATLSYKDDFPSTPGNCAACHAPGAATEQPYGIRLDELKGVNALGVHCDFCHKIYETQVPRQGMPGVLSISLRRPSPGGKDILFGPFDDITRGKDSYLPLQHKSEYCAPCHNHESWGVPIYSTYSEWRASRYAELGVQCQDCHYKPDGRTSNVAPNDDRAIERDPAKVPSHNLMGEDRYAFIASAVSMDVESTITEKNLRVTIDIENIGAGHYFPTGQPMRNAILVVEATDQSGVRLELTHGDVIPTFGGEGDSERDFSGRPGRLFAKVLEELPDNYPDRPAKPIRIPSPQWVRNRIRFDTRIPPLKTDSSEYTFRLSDKETVHLQVRLLYRRFYLAFERTKGWNGEDIEIATFVENLNVR